MGILAYFYIALKYPRRECQYWKQHANINNIGVNGFLFIKATLV